MFMVCKVKYGWCRREAGITRFIFWGGLSEMSASGGYNPFRDKVLWALVVISGLVTLTVFGKMETVLAWLATILAPWL